MRSVLRELSSPWAQLAQFLRDPIPVLEKAGRSDDPVVPFKLGVLTGYLVNSPEYAQLALESDRWPPLSRGRMADLVHWYEDGLAIKTGSPHHEHRDRMWIPKLNQPWLARLAAEQTALWADGWRDGGRIEAYEELRRLAYSIGWRVLTGEELLRDRPGIYDSLAAADDWLGRLVHPFGPLRWRLPTPEGIRGRRLRRNLDAAIDDAVAKSRSGEGPKHLLAEWIEVGEELGATDADLRGSVKAYFGAENLHTHIAWTFHLLAQNPDQEARLHDELDRVLEGRVPTPDDLDQLRYTRWVTMESLRLYPSVPAFFRGIDGGDLELDGTVIPDGSLLAFSPWVIHRSSRYWDDPLRFDPERWDSPDVSKRHRYAYFPFAGGPYRCPGTGKSVNEGPLVLATLAKDWRMRPPARTDPPKPTAKWALKPARGMPMLTQRRG